VLLAVGIGSGRSEFLGHGDGCRLLGVGPLGPGQFSGGLGGEMCDVVLQAGEARPPGLVAEGAARPQVRGVAPAGVPVGSLAGGAEAGLARGGPEVEVLAVGRV